MKVLIKIVKGVIYTVVALLLVLVVLNISPFTISKVKGKNEFRTKDKYPLVIPHGGAKELVPENTVYSYNMLVEEYEVDVLEIDLALTKDNILITHHDLDLDMSPNHEYNDKLIKTLTYDEIINAYEEDDYYLARNFVDINGEKPFEVGGSLDDEEIIKQMVPAKMSDIFDLVGNDLLYILEIKDAPTARGYDDEIHDFEVATQTLIDLIKEYELEEYVVIGSFEDEVINYIKDVAPEIKVGAAINEATNFALYSAFYIDFFFKVNSEVLILPNPSSMNIPENLISTVEKIPKFIRKNIAIKSDTGVWQANLMSKSFIKKAHRKNMAVFYWTINDEDEMRKLIKDGADGIITDRPDLLIDIINELKGD